MKLKSLVAVALVSMASVASATTSWDLGEFTVTYDETTSFGFLAGAFFSGDGARGFSWTVPDSVKVVSLGASESITFDLPSFTLTANAGYTLGGPVSSFLGNLVFTEVGLGATTSMSGSGDVSFDGGAVTTQGGFLTQTVLASGGGFASGYFSGAASAPYGNFTSLTMTNGSITLTAVSGTYASIISQPQNKLEFTFTSQPVPEPRTYAMFLAGIAALGWVVRRRQNRS